MADRQLPKTAEVIQAQGTPGYTVIMVALGGAYVITKRLDHKTKTTLIPVDEVTFERDQWRWRKPGEKHA